MTYNATKMRELRARRRDERPRTLAESLRRQIVAEYEQSRRLAFPCTEFQDDIDGFARRVLGVRSTRKQRQLYAIAERMYKRGAKIKRAAIRSCVKSGKTRTVAVLALWRYCCWADSRTLLTGPSERSVQKLAWREVRMLKARSGVCVECRDADPELDTCEHSAPIPGDCSDQARTGLRGLGFAEVFGLVAKVDENLQGYSDPSLVILGDEAVAIAGNFYDALHGNMGSSVHGFEMWFSNPNRIGGWFHNAFTRNAARWELDKISAFDVCDEGVPGIITREFIATLLDDYGEESDAYRIRVLAEFPASGSGGLFTAALLDAAVARWQLSHEGMLVIAVDPATSEDNDAVGFAVRRGLSIQHIGLEYGLSIEAMWQHVEGLIAEHARPGEALGVSIDANGIGYELCSLARGKIAGRPIQLTQVRASDKAVRKPQTYRLVRDELVDCLFEFLRDGGSLPPGESDMLLEEAPCFSFAEGQKGLLVATPKKLIKKQIGRSPDSFDAVALAAWVKVVTPRRARAAAGRGGAAASAPRDARAAAADQMARLKAGASVGARR